MTTPYDPPPDGAGQEAFARAVPPLAPNVEPPEPATPDDEAWTSNAAEQSAPAAFGSVDAPAEATPSSAGAAPGAPAPAVLDLPLSGRRLLPISLDLLMRAETGLRAASFYIGFVLAVTVGPVIALTAAAAVVLGDGFLDENRLAGETWPAWLFVTGAVAFAGYLVAAVESRVLAAAVIGATIEGRPLAIGGLLRLSRRRFWRAIRAVFLIGIPTTLGQRIGSGLATALGDPTGQLDFAFQIIGGVAFGVPFAYALAGVVIGEVGARESVRRSWRLFRARPTLALVVAAFSLVSQFVIVFALSAGLDVTVRIFAALGIEGDVPWIAAVVASFVFTFAFGTLLFLSEAIAATPQVHAFIALTHYTRGLDDARAATDVARGRRAWVSRPLLIGVILAFAGLAAGVASLPI